MSRDGQKRPEWEDEEGDGWWDTDWDEPGDEDADCTRCGGEGWTECDDPIQCTREHDAGGWHPCKACGGSGDAKDQTVW